MSTVHQGLPTHLYFNFQDPAPSQSMSHFNNRHSGEARSSTYVVIKPVSHRMRVCPWFSAISTLWLQEIRFSLWAHKETFRSSMQHAWAGNLNPWTHPFLSQLCPATIGATSQPHSLYPLFCQKCLKVLYTQSPRSLLLQSSWLGVSNCDIYPIYIVRSHHGVSVLFLLLEIKPLASLNLIGIGNQFQKSRNNSENWSLTFCSSRTPLSTKICISQGSPEK